MADVSSLKTSIVKRPIGPSGYGGATALQSICLDGSIIWIIKNSIRGSTANCYSRIYKYDINKKSLKDIGESFNNLGHSNGCTYYNGNIFVASYHNSINGVVAVNTSTWETKVVSKTYCTGIDYYGGNQFILQLGGDSYGLFNYSDGKFSKVHGFTLKGYGIYSTNQDITYNNGTIYRIAVNGACTKSAIICYSYDGGSGTYKPQKVYTYSGELESMVFHNGKPYIGNNMSHPGDALITTSSFKGGDNPTGSGTNTSNDEEDKESTEQKIPITYPSVVEITGYYEFYCGQDNSQVISFSPEWEDMTAQGGNWLVKSAAAVDEIRNELITTQVSSGNYKQSEGTAGRVMGKSSSSIQNLTVQSQSMWEKNYSRMNKATMEIMGDPDTYPGKYIYVDVFTKYGFRHHTSGIYYVEEAEDSISQGSFITTLQLRKYGTYGHYYNSLVDDEAAESSKKEDSDENPDSESSSTKEEVINGACEWARNIANDNSFHYGYSTAALSRGCYFCKTNGHKKGHMVDYEKTYCCNTFVFSAYAHGGNEPEMLEACKKGKNAKTGTFQGLKGYAASESWDKVGKISKDKLQKGDVLAYSGHWALFIGDGKIAEAAHRDDNKKNSNSWNNSIRVTSLRTNYECVYRYNGKGLPKNSGTGGTVGNPYGGSTKFTITSIACVKGYDDAHKDRYHSGWDLAIGGTPPIYAVSAGEVTFAGTIGSLTTGYGTHVVIIKSGSLHVLYGHMSAMYVKKGDTVTKGQKIGKQGNEGRSFGNHLHLEFRKGGQEGTATANLDNVDPMFKKYATNYSDIKKDYNSINPKN